MHISFFFKCLHFFIVLFFYTDKCIYRRAPLYQPLLSPLILYAASMHLWRRVQSNPAVIFKFRTISGTNLCQPLLLLVLIAQQRACGDLWPHASQPSALRRELPVRACLLPTSSSWILGLQWCRIPRVSLRSSTTTAPFVFPLSNQQQPAERLPAPQIQPSFQF